MDLQKISDAFKTIAAEFSQLEPEPTGTEFYAATEAELYNALSKARGGDKIILKNRTFFGSFTLPRFDGEGWVEITTEDEGRAIIASNDWQMPLFAASNSHHWRLNRINVTQTSTNTFDLFRIGSHLQTLEQVPHHFEILDSYFYVQPDQQQRRAININASDVLIEGCKIWGMKDKDGDSQGIGSSHSPGRVWILNNSIEAASENVLFGGDDPRIPGLIPTDIEISGNIFTKPLEWMGKGWNTKNLLELKNAKRVKITQNLFTGCWKDGQDGYAVVFTPRNQYGKAPWCTVEDVLFAFNKIERSSSGINILGTDNEQKSDVVKRIRIRDNYLNLNHNEFGGSGYCLQINGGIVIVVDHNTMLSTGSLVGAYGDPTDRFTFTNNVGYHGLYGIFGAAYGVGSSAIERYFPNGIFKNNIIAGDMQGNKYPEGTINPTTAELAAGLDVEMKVSDARWVGAGTDGRNLGYNDESDYEGW